MTDWNQFIRGPVCSDPSWQGGRKDEEAEHEGCKSRREMMQLSLVFKIINRSLSNPVAQVFPPCCDYKIVAIYWLF